MRPRPWAGESLRRRSYTLACASLIGELICPTTKPYSAISWSYGEFRRVGQGSTGRESPSCNSQPSFRSSKKALYRVHIGVAGDCNRTSVRVEPDPKLHEIRFNAETLMSLPELNCPDANSLDTQPSGHQVDLHHTAMLASLRSEVVLEHRNLQTPVAHRLREGLVLRRACIASFYWARRWSAVRRAAGKSCDKAFAVWSADSACSCCPRRSNSWAKRR